MEDWPKNFLVGFVKVIKSLKPESVTDELLQRYTQFVKTFKVHATHSLKDLQ